MRPRHSLAAKILIPTFVPVAIAVAIAVSIMVSGNERTAKSIVKERSEKLALVSAARVSEGLSHYVAILGIHALDASVTPIDVDAIEECLRDSPEIDVFDAGTVVYGTMGQALGSVPYGLDRRGQEFPSHALWQTMRRTLRPVYSPAFFDRVVNRDVILIAVPIVDDRGTFQGALAGLSTVRYSSLSSDLAELCELAASDTGYAYLVDGTGRVIYHQHPSAVGSSADDFEPVRRALRGEFGAMLGQDAGGVEILYAYAAVPGTDWALVLQQSWNEIVGAIRQSARTVVWVFALGALAVAALVTYLLRRALGPIHDLTRGAERLANGDRSHRIEIRSADEVAVLAHQFNRMSEALDDSFNELEARLAEQQAMRQALQESETALDKAQELANIGSYVWNAADDTLIWSRNMYAMAGLEPGDLPDTLRGAYAKVIHPDDLERVIEQVSGMLARKRGSPTEFCLLRPDGQERLVRSDAEFILDAEGNVTRVVGVHHDITEQRRAEQALQDYSVRLELMVAERTAALSDAQDQLLHRERLAALGQLAGGVAHELRNPLGAIANAIYYLRAIMDEAGPAYREPIEIIASETDRANDVITTLMDYARSHTPQLEVVTLESIVAGTLASQIPPEGIAVDLALPEDLSLVQVDPQHMVIVLGNLVANAYQAMPNGGALTLRAHDARDHVVVEVSDTGTGIAPENAARIFEPLFTTKSKGIGLGLALSRNLAQANGGTIALTSKVGVGTTFTLTLPAAPSLP